MLSKRLRIISRKLRNLKGTQKTSNILNKKVLSKSGEYVGRVKDIILKKDVFQGIFVLGKNKIIVGREFIASISKDHIMLKIEPVTNMLGKTVFDSRGKRIGKIKDVTRKSHTNNYHEIRVKNSMFKRSFLIPKKEIATAKKSIILKNPYEHDKKKKKKEKKEEHYY
mgnify:CR=1 FL=1